MNKIYAIGEYIIDFLDQGNHQFLAQPGGAPANVAVCIAQLGGKTALITSLGNDLFKKQLIDVLIRKNVDISHVSVINKPNMLAFLSLDEHKDRTFNFYQTDTANHYLDLDSIQNIDFNKDVLHFCSVSLQNLQNQQAHKKAIMSVKEKHGLISFDPNLRFNLWQNKDILKSVVLDFLKHADIVKLSEEELYFLSDEINELAAVKKLWNDQTKIIWVTKGEQGVDVYTNSQHKHISGLKVNVIDTTGAGDAFIGAILFCIQKHQKELTTLSIEEISEMTEYANRVAAHSTMKYGAITSYVFDDLLD